MTADAPRPVFSRAEVLEGLPARRASTLLFAIESRTAELVARSRTAMATFRTERTDAERERQFLNAMAAGREPPLRPTIQDIERYAPRWAPLVPPDTDLRAALARLLGAKYRFRRRDVPRIRAALGLDAADVGNVFGRLHAAPLESVYAPSVPLGERLRWARSRIAAGLEELPPFWTAFALTLTETVGAGVLALPIALAGPGPMAAIGLLLAVGLVNLVTIAALVEAITRNGSIRYGTAYFGRLVGDYLGRPGKVTLGLTLFVHNGLVMVVLAVGFGLTIAGATGIPAPVCAAILFAVVLAIVRRESLDATVASALLIGGANLAMLLVISFIAAAHVRPDGFEPAPPLFGPGSDVTTLALAFGVVLASYFGHSSAANAARVVLTQDPSGRALLRGNLAAMTVVIAIYAVVVLAILGAVGSDELLDYPGTAITPLAEVAGPVISILGSIYAALAMGLGSIHVALGLFNQVGELLPRGDRSGGAEPRSTWLAWLGSGPGRTIARLLPLLVVFAILEWLILTGRESFTAALGYIGALIIPILGGVFPMLMLAAGRRRGPYVPGAVLRAIGHPVTVVAVAGLYLVAVLAHGLFIWQGPVERAAAVVASLLMAAIIVVAVRGGSFRPRAVLEIRADDRTDRLVTCALTSMGQPSPFDVVVERRGEEQGAATKPGTAADVGRLDEVAAITFTLGEAVRPLDVWAHRVDVAGDSQPLPVDVAVAAHGAEPVPWRSAGLHVGELDAGSRIRIAVRATDPAAVTSSPDLRATFGDAGLPQPERVR